MLILGGTAEARSLAGLLHADPRFAVTSSLAGRVAQPRLPVGEVRIGGFGGAVALAEYARGFDQLVDATHPFAARISRNAAEAAEIADVPVLAVVRPPWESGPDDRWTHVSDVAGAAGELHTRSAGRAMLTTGRQDAHEFAHLASWWFLIRVVDAPTGELPPNHQLLRSRGPYTVEAESSLLRDNRVDVLVTKNSGGHLVSAKLTAARALGIELIMVDRPLRPDRVPTVETAAAAYSRLTSCLA